MRTKGYFFALINAMVLTGLVAIGGYLMLVDFPRRGAEARLNDNYNTPPYRAFARENLTYRAEDLDESNLQDMDGYAATQADKWLMEEGEIAEGFVSDPLLATSDVVFVPRPSIKLHGIYYCRRDERVSTAFISVDGGDQDLYVIGGSFLSKGYRWRIVTINSHDIICSPELNPTEKRSFGLTSIGDGDTGLAQRKIETQDTYFTVSRGLFDRYRNDIRSFFRGLDVEYELDESGKRVNGVRVANLAVGHVAFEHGMRSGDVILSVNGDFLDAPVAKVWEKWKNLFAKYRDYSMFYMKVARKGIVYSVVVEVK